MLHCFPAFVCGVASASLLCWYVLVNSEVLHCRGYAVQVSTTHTAFRTSYYQEFKSHPEFASVHRFNSIFGFPCNKCILYPMHFSNDTDPFNSPLQLSLGAHWEISKEWMRATPHAFLKLTVSLNSPLQRSRGAGDRTNRKHLFLILTAYLTHHCSCHVVLMSARDPETNF